MVRDWLKNNWRTIIIGVLSVAVMSLILSTTCVSHNNKNLKNNIKALTDTVQTVRLKNGELLSAKQSLIIDKKQLEEYLDISKQEQKELQKQLGSALETISKLKGQIRIDTIVCHDTTYIENDGSRIIKFEYDDDWLALNGVTRCVSEENCSTTIQNINMSVPLTVGRTEDNKVFVKTANPYIYFTDINSALIDNYKTKPKHWNVGFQVSAISVQYDLIHKTVGVGPSLGVGLSVGYSF